MPITQMFPAVVRLRQRLSVLGELPLTDAELLARFISSRDEDAFGELVRRHGPAVLAVCRRVTGNRDDADDAFQAAFLVLARKADRVSSGFPLGGWLYGVAVRAARKAVARSARRRSRETAVAELPEVSDRRPEADPETVRAVLDEVARLSDAYRSAVVLCELEGQSRAAAARELGIAEGTLSSRLAAARKVLARRFRDRGLVPAVLAAVAGSASCPVLAADAARLGGASASPAPGVEELSEAVMRSVLLSKWNLAPVAAALTAVGLAIIAAEPLPPATANPVPTAQPAPSGTLLLSRDGAFWVVTPDGKKLAELPLPEKTLSGGRAALSPDGTRAALIVADGEIREQTAYQIVVGTLAAPAEAKVWGAAAVHLHVCWTADGKRLVVSKQMTQDPPETFEHVLLDPDTGTAEPLDLPAGVWRVLDAARDRKTFLVIDRKDGTFRLGLATVGGKEVRALTDIKARYYKAVARLSPDGSRVLLADSDPDRKLAHNWGLGRRVYVVDVATGKHEPLAGFPDGGEAWGVAWSPDGKKIAYTWRQVHGDLLADNLLVHGETLRDTEAFLVVADADGKNPKTIASEKGRYAFRMIFASIDWR